MRYAFGMMALCCTLSLGCAKPTQTAANGAANAEGGATASDEAADSAEAKVVEVKVADDGSAKLTPENTKIGFVAVHTGEDPKPRTGGFEKFQGKAQLDSEKKGLEAVEVAIPVNSIWTEFAMLTGHLQKSDFFDAEKIPTATFVSKKIEPGDKEGEVKITGDLTMHGVTKEFSFPATVTIADGTLKLNAKFKINQSEHGMVKDGVADGVEVEVVIGEKTEKLPEKSPIFG